MAGASASGHQYGVYALILEALGNCGAGLMGELFNVAAAAHEAYMNRSYALDEAFLGKLMEPVDGEHAVDILVDVAVIIAAMGNHQIAGGSAVVDLAPGEVAGQIEALILFAMYACCGSEGYYHLVQGLGYRCPYRRRRNGNENFGL